MSTLCDMTPEAVWDAYTEACDEVATLLAELHIAKVELEKVRAERDAIEAKYGRLVWAIEIDKDGDGFICKEVMDELLNEDDTPEG